jgi:hypothetical protein
MLAQRLYGKTSVKPFTAGGASCITGELFFSTFQSAISCRVDFN